MRLMLCSRMSQLGICAYSNFTFIQNSFNNFSHLTSVEIGVPEQHHLRSPLSAQHASDCCAPPAFTVWLSCSSRVIAVKKEMDLVTVITIAASSCEQA
jgi:hypothetical protein